MNLLNFGMDLGLSRARERWICLLAIAALLLPGGTALGQGRHRMAVVKSRPSAARGPILVPAPAPAANGRALAMADPLVVRAEVIVAAIARAIRYVEPEENRARVVAPATVIPAEAPAISPTLVAPKGAPETIFSSALFPRLPSWDRDPVDEPAGGGNGIGGDEVAVAGELEPAGIDEAGEPAPDAMVARLSSSEGVKAFIVDCVALSRRGLKYEFGSNDPKEGGLDCSGTVQYLLQERDIASVPRQSNLQYEWLRENGTLKKVGFFNSGERVLNDLKPGDLLFWKDTYNSGRSPNITHVMVYLGWDRRSGKHKMFGARGSRARGDHGHGVDVFDLEYPFSQGKGKFVAYGSVPGLKA